MEKKNAIITGADGGMGREITLALAEAGYHVIMLCYSAQMGEDCIRELRKKTDRGEMEVMQVDLSSMKSVEQVADQIIARGKPINLLMNNAGMLARQLVRTEDGFEKTVAVNYVAPYFLTRKLLPLMHCGSRVVSMISCSYVKGKLGPHFFSHGKEGEFSRIPVYSNTKLALWYFTSELARRVRDRGILVNAADPGIVSTEIIRMHKWFDVLTDHIYRPFIRTPRQGADMAIRLLLDPDFQQVSGGVFHSGRQKKVRRKFSRPEKMLALWNETENRLKQMGHVLLD